MNPFKRMINSLKAQNNTPVDKPKRKRLTGAINTTLPQDRIDMEMKSLNDAVEIALYPPQPRRRELIAIYRRTVTDAHVFGQFEIAKSKIVAEQFVVSKNGVDDPDLTSLFKKPWFEQYLEICFDAMMWGYTLVEFGQLVNGAWDSVNVFPRRHVEPFSRNILIYPGDVSGIYYGDKPQALYLLEIGKPEDLGLLQIISREVIWKNFSRSDWSQSSEKFGMPVLYIKTATDNEAELEWIETMCKNFASNGYLISDIDDEVSIIQVARSDTYKIYLENAIFCDDSISKCINGQSSTSDPKAFVGAAQVHERILDVLHSARLRHISNLINYSLFPFLIYHGFSLDNCSLRFPSLDLQTITPDKTGTNPDLETNDLDNPAGNNLAGSGGTGLKKKSSRLSLKLPGWVIAMPGE